jgi:hypothetical protein
LIYRDNSPEISVRRTDWMTVSNIRNVPRAVLEAHEIALTLSRAYEQLTVVLCLWDPEDVSRRDAVGLALKAYFPD